jgi:outer membrane protein assembly factor BamB
MTTAPSADVLNKTGTLNGTPPFVIRQANVFRVSVATLLTLGLFVLASCSVTPASGDSATSSTVAQQVAQQGARETGAHDWTRFGWDASRSNASTDATGITAANVASLRRQRVTIDGTVDSSPVYLHGININDRARDVFFVTTTYGKTLAIDASDGSILWRYTPPGFSSWEGSRQITTATPVADPDRNFIYAASPDGHIQKLSVADGHAVWSTAITLLPTREKIASSLNFDRGHVIATTGGYIGDAPPYQGHVAILDGATGRLLHVWNSLCSFNTGLMQPRTCNQSGSAIWGRAGAVIDSHTGDMFIATGNATWDGQTNWGDAAIALDSSAKMIDNYAPANTLELSERDADVGSTSPAILGNGYFAQGGKDGKIRVIQFGRTRGSDARRGGELQIVSTPSGGDMFTSPVVWHPGSTTWLIAADNGGTAAWTFTNGHLTEVWKNRNGGTSPVLAGGLLYVYDLGGGLRVYVPTTGKEITTLESGSGHWNTPIIVDGRIALPEGNANRHSKTGVLNIWRLQ